MEQNRHPIGALAFTLVFIVVAVVLWFAIYGLMLARG